MGFDYKIFLEELMKYGFIKNEQEFNTLLETRNTGLLISVCERVFDKYKKSQSQLNNMALHMCLHPLEFSAKGFYGRACARLMNINKSYSKLFLDLQTFFGVGREVLFRDIDGNLYPLDMTPIEDALTCFSNNLLEKMKKYSSPNFLKEDRREITGEETYTLTIKEMGDLTFHWYNVSGIPYNFEEVARDYLKKKEQSI